MDYRDRRDREVIDVYERFDKERNILVFLIEDCETCDGDDPDCTECGAFEVPAIFEVCHRCDGRGRYVNPSIDAHGITGDEWAEWDYDDRETYRSGGYDITCVECGGERVLPQPDPHHTPEKVLSAIRASEQSLREMYAEMAAERRYGA